MVYRWFNLEELTKQAQFSRPRDGLGAVTHEELAEDVVNVRFDRPNGEVELTGDLSVRPACGDELENLYLAPTQRLEPRGTTTARPPLPESTASRAKCSSNLPA